MNSETGCEELVKEWNGPRAETAVTYLRERGFLFDGHAWSVRAGFQVCDKDKRAILFLHEEWGYPGQCFEQAPLKNQIN